MRNRWLTGVWAIVLLVSIGCQSSLEALTPTASTTQTPVPSPTSQPQSATTVPVTPEPAALVVWLPDVLFDLDDDALSALLTAEVNEFSLQTGIRVELRRKKPDDVGGILSTLRAAAVVAPGALPDLTLMRRSDLLAAVGEGLIHPMEGRIASAVIADLYPSALRLGRAADQLFGLPYLLDFYLTAYRSDTVTLDQWTFAHVLESKVTLAIPASSAVGLNEVLWLQYLASGGLIPEANAPLTLAPSPVLTILSFYEDMLQANLITPAVMDYDSSQDYIQLIADGRLDAGVISTANLHDLIGSDVPLAFAPVPSQGAESLSLVDGWMWVIITPNAEQQALSGRFLNWMMDSGRQSTYANEIAMPPSQRSAMRRWVFEGLDNNLFADMLNSSPPPMPEISASSAARALQSALLDVLSGEMSASEAAAAVLTP